MPQEVLSSGWLTKVTVFLIVPQPYSYRHFLGGCLLAGETRGVGKLLGDNSKLGFILNCLWPIWWGEIIVLAYGKCYRYIKLSFSDSKPAGSCPPSRWASECWQPSQRDVAQFQMSSLKGWPGAHGQVTISVFLFLFTTHFFVFKYKFSRRQWKWPCFNLRQWPKSFPAVNSHSLSWFVLFSLQSVN